MCGVLGFIGPQLGLYTRDVLQRLAARLAHRGPDHTGLYDSPQFKAASVRLSIIDLASGNQPIATEDNRYVIVFNGEIFNYRSLREELAGRGIRFRTQSDTEVLLQLLALDGERALQRIEGQFAFLFYDTQRNELMAARDRWGICPLFITELEHGNILLTSEYKVLLDLPDYRFRLDPRGIQQIAWSWSNLPPTTAWQGIEELPPGHLLRASLDSSGSVTLERQRYFDLAAHAQDCQPEWRTIADATDGLREMLIHEVEKHMVADVPVAAYLSGGVDSSVLTAIARTFNPDVRTFSIAFDHDSFDESNAQQQFIDQHHLPTSTVRVTRDDIRRSFPAAVYHAEKPLFRCAPVPLFLLSQRVNEEGIKVVLSGEGADEVFWGYDTFRELVIRRLWSGKPDSDWRPGLLQKIFSYFPQYSNPRYFKFLRSFYEQTLNEVSHPLYPMLPRLSNGMSIAQYMNGDLRTPVEQLEHALVQAMPPGTHNGDVTALQRCQMIELATLLPGYLLSSQGDRMLAAHSVEGRFPFLGLPLVSTLFTLPDLWKLRGLRDKVMLRDAFKGWIPETIRTRPKFPYRAPDVESFFPDPPQYVQDMLSARYAKQVGMFEPVAVEKLRDKLAARREGQPVTMRDNVALTWILSTHVLHACYVDRTAPAVME